MVILFNIQTLNSKIRNHIILSLIYNIILNTVPEAGSSSRLLLYFLPELTVHVIVDTQLFTKQNAVLFVFAQISRLANFLGEILIDVSLNF